MDRRDGGAPPHRTVLLTGAAGRVGSGFRDEYWQRYRDSYRLRLGVHRDGCDDPRFNDVVPADTADPAELVAACRGVDSIVHLAANSDFRAGFHEVLQPNLVGLYNLLEAAGAAGVRRLVFASSVHAVMGHPVDVQAGTRCLPRADGHYGLSKIHGEAMCRYYADFRGLSCLCLRIGAYRSPAQMAALAEEDNPQLLDIVLSPRDMGQIIHRSIMAPPGLRFGIYNAISDNRFKRMDLEDARRDLGYAPQDDAFRISRRIGFGAERKV